VTEAVDRRWAEYGIPVDGARNGRPGGVSQQPSRR
jgi:hypothetical protein